MFHLEKMNHRKLNFDFLSWGGAAKENSTIIRINSPGFLFEVSDNIDINLILLKSLWICSANKTALLYMHSHKTQNRKRQK